MSQTDKDAEYSGARPSDLDFSSSSWRSLKFEKKMN